MSLIATPRDDFVTCRVDEVVAEVLGRNQDALFDHIPVVATTPNEEIVGVFDAVDWFEKAPPAGDVEGTHRPLSEDILIGADASVLDFIREADERPFRFVVSDLGISGLVSLSDLQQIAVRAALFAMVTHLETVMAAAIRARWSTEGWLARLEPQQRGAVEATIRRGQRENTLVDPVLYTSLTAKIFILQDAIPAELGGRDRFRAELGDLPSFRNSLAHASEYADTRERARRVCALVRAIDRWIRELDEWSRAAAGSGRSEPVEAALVEAEARAVGRRSGKRLGYDDLPRVLCIGVDVTWWGGGSAPASRFETLVSASLVEPEALRIERVDLGGAPNPRRDLPTEPNFDPEGELLTRAILEVIDRHPGAERVIVALDAPLECCARPGQEPRQKSVPKGVSMGSQERQAEKELRAFMRGARTTSGWNRDLRIQAGSPIPPRIAKVVEGLRTARPDLLPTYTHPRSEPRGVVEVFPSEAIWALGLQGAYGALDSASVRSYKSKEPQVLDLHDAAVAARQPLVGFLRLLESAGVPDSVLGRWTDAIVEEAARIARDASAGRVLKRKCFDDPIDSGIAFLTAVAAAVGEYHTWGDGSDGLILGPGRLESDPGLPSYRSIEKSGLVAMSAESERLS